MVFLSGKKLYCQGKFDTLNCNRHIRIFKIFPYNNLNLNITQDGVFTELQVLNILFQIFQGNTDVNSVVQHDLMPVIEARYIRVHPGYDKGSQVCMRLELYGCAATVETGL